MSSPDAEAGDDALARRLAAENPHPELRMTRYEGSLCPAESLVFSSSDGAFTLHFPSGQSGVQDCNVHIALSVPAGYRFRKPIFIARGWAERLDDTVPPTRIALTYAFSETRLTSHHVVWGTTLATSGESGFDLIDTPELTVPECTNPAEPIDLDLEVAVKVDTPEGGYVELFDLEAELEVGVEWVRCGVDFHAP